MKINQEVIDDMMLKYRSVLIATYLQPPFIICFLIFVLLRTAFSTNLLRIPKHARPTRSDSKTYQVTFLLPDELTANYFIGNIPANLPNFLSVSDLETTFSVTLVDASGFAQRIINVSDTGDLFTKTFIDRDNRDQICGPLKCCRHMVCNLTVLALFVHPVKPTIKVEVILQLHDSNDNSPLFSQNTFSLWIPEHNGLHGTYDNHPINYSLPLAKDLDSDPNGIIAYRLTGSSFVTRTFYLIATTGNNDLRFGVRPGTIIDYESSESKTQEIIIEAIDGGQPPKTGVLLLMVSITDINDNYPLFLPLNKTFHLEENKIYAKAIATIRATDLDAGKNGQVVYTLSADNINTVKLYFHIHQETGELKLIQPLDFEKYDQRRIDIRIIAHDLGIPALSSTMTLTVIVEDINDNPPHLVVQTNNTITENDPPNQLALRLSVRDHDEVSKNKVFCSENDVSDKRIYFNLSTENMLISIYTKSRLDYEQTPRLYFTIVCTDNAYPRQIRIFNLTIAVADINDNHPVFKPTSINKDVEYLLEIYEDVAVNKMIFFVSAEDVDDGAFGTVEYAINETEIVVSKPGYNSEEFFRIDKQTGGVFVNRPLDYETIPVHNFKVIGFDNPNGKPMERNTATARVRIKLIDVNDHLPKLITPKEFSILENTPIGRRIGHVRFSDADHNGVDPITIHGLVADASRAQHENNGYDDLLAAKHFKITDDGQIITAANLDRELQETFTLRILASDSGFDVVHTTTVTITIRLLDMDDNNPSLVYPESNSVQVYKPASLNEKVLNVVYHNYNGTVEYGTKSTASEIISKLNSGHIAGKLSQFITEPVVLQLVAADPDDGPNGEVLFELLYKCNGSSYFFVERNTGAIHHRIQMTKLDRKATKMEINSLLWYPSPGLYHMCVQLNDQGQESRKGYSEFWLHVLPLERKINSVALWPADAAITALETNYDLRNPTQMIYEKAETTDTKSDVLSTYSNFDGVKIDKPNWSNIVIVIMFIIFALTVACALGAALYWAQSRHRRRRHVLTHRGRNAITEVSKWIANDKCNNNHKQSTDLNHTMPCTEQALAADLHEHYLFPIASDVCVDRPSRSIDETFKVSENTVTVHDLPEKQYESITLMQLHTANSSAEKQNPSENVTAFSTLLGNIPIQQMQNIGQGSPSVHPISVMETVAHNCPTHGTRLVFSSEETSLMASNPQSLLICTDHEPV